MASRQPSPSVVCRLGYRDPLPEAARLAFEVLCCLEEDDRSSFVLEAKWGDVWQRLERNGRRGAPYLLRRELALELKVESLRATKARLKPVGCWRPKSASG